MARVIFSALLSAASGKIGDVVMSRWKGIPYVRRRVIPANPQSGDQTKQRYVLKVALLLWQSVKLSFKAPWDVAMSGYALSGYNQFMDDCIAKLIPQFTAGGVAEDPAWSAPAVTVGTPFNALYPALIDVDAGTPAANEVVFTWTARANPTAYNIVVGRYRLDNATAWSSVANVAESTETITFATLTDALQYEFMLAAMDTETHRWSLSVHKLQTPGA